MTAFLTGGGRSAGDIVAVLGCGSSMREGLVLTRETLTFRESDGWN
jgi:hypothetical protein